MSIQQYLPVLGQGLKQEQLLIFSGEETDPSEYRTLHFSEEFKWIYGTPILWWSAWYRLMTISVDKIILPKLKKDFIWVAQHIFLLDFCKDSGLLPTKRGCRF
jgi:hypothetical protein